MSADATAHPHLGTPPAASPHGPPAADPAGCPPLPVSPDGSGEIVKITTWPSLRPPENLVPRNRDTMDLLDALLEANAKQAFRRGSVKSRHYSLNMLGLGRESWGIVTPKSRLSADVFASASEQADELGLAEAVGARLGPLAAIQSSDE